MHHPDHPAHPNPITAKKDGAPQLRLLAWETTRNCNLSCVHCRASATCGPYTGELNTSAAFRLLEQVARVGSPIVILTGGEPLLREDIFDITAFGTAQGLRMVMAPNGTLVTPAIARKLSEAGIKRISVSLDGADAERHDRFRGVRGAFEGALGGIRNAQAAGIEFQINTTITKANLDQIPKILRLAEQLGAVAHHIFLLVPTGRGKYIVDQAIDAREYENTLNWFYDQRARTRLQLKATCAPHYHRIMRQRAKAEGQTVTFQTHGLDAVTRGCLAGSGFCFVSHRGIVQPCGFLDLNCGDVTHKDFADIWYHSPHFITLRDPNQLKGKCGACGYRKVCGGCRARAHEAVGDFMEAEPLCLYEPSAGRQ